MSEIKNGGLDQYGAEPFKRQQFGTAGVEGVNYYHAVELMSTARKSVCCARLSICAMCRMRCAVSKSRSAFCKLRRPTSNVRKHYGWSSSSSVSSTAFCGATDTDMRYLGDEKAR